jgi:hypothetical protein
MTQRANLRAPRRNDLAAAPAQLPYSDFLSLRSGRDKGLQTWARKSTTTMRLLLIRESAASPARDAGVSPPALSMQSDTPRGVGRPVASPSKLERRCTSGQG